MDRYSDTVFSIRQITKQHQKHYVWNHINDHPNMMNDTLARHKR